MERRAVAALALILIAASTRSAAQESVAHIAPLHVIPTENQSVGLIAPDQPARVRLLVTNPEGVARTLGGSVPADGHWLEYVIDKYPQLRGADERSWLESTFVIDFTEPVFETLRKELGGNSTHAQLVEFVARIVENTQERGWDLASVVARRREGDCTEHAVLTAALARMHGIPARVALGVALITEGNRHGAYGHAWAELLENGKWTVADAALIDSGTKGTVRYLPMGVLDDEGMGYTMNLAQLVNNWVDRVVVLGPAR